jgi:mRNA-degrading endonuclease RelE of RelBE toxin-antitoxin system
LSKKSQKNVKRFQKVFKKFSKSCQKVVKKLSKSKKDWFAARWQSCRETQNQHQGQPERKVLEKQRKGVSGHAYIV